MAQKSVIYILIFLFPVLFIVFSQPLILRLLLTLQTLFIRLFLFLVYKTTWLSFVLVLIIIGGLMISFIYISSLIPFIFIPVFTIILNYKLKLVHTNLHLNLPRIIFESSTLWGMLFVVVILVLTLFVVCLNIYQLKSPLRTFN